MTSNPVHFASFRLDASAPARGRRLLGRGVVATALAFGASAAPTAVASWSTSVSSFVNNAVVRYEGDTGQAIDHLVANGISSLVNPRGMTIGPDGLLYVCSSGSDQVLRYDPQTGQPIDVFIQSGFGLDGPQEIVFNGPYAYVTSFLNNRVLRYDAEFGTYVDTFITPGSGGLNGPVGLAFGPNGHAFVSSIFTHQVLRYDGASGVFLDVFVSAASGGLLNPWGLHFLDGGPLLVAGAGSASILRYNPSTGAFIGALVGPGGTNPIAPAFIRIGPDGDLYVPNQLGAMSSVYRFNAVTGAFLGTVVSPGAGGLNGAFDVVFVNAPADCSGDVDGNGVVDGADLGLMLGNWGLCAP
jgi:streptogramin lyase